jgi:hypothetical protein
MDVRTSKAFSSAENLFGKMVIAEALASVKSSVPRDFGFFKNLPILIASTFNVALHEAQYG